MSAECHNCADNRGPAPASPAPPGTAIPRPPKPIHWGFYAVSIGGQCADGISTKRFLARGWHETTAGFGWVEDHPNLGIAMKCTMGYLFARFGDWLHAVGVRNNWREVRWLGKAVPVAAGFFGFKVAIHNERLR